MCRNNPKAAAERYPTYRLDVLSIGAIRMANEVYEAQCGLTVRDLRSLRLVDDNPDTSPSASLTEQTLPNAASPRDCCRD